MIVTAPGKLLQDFPFSDLYICLQGNAPAHFRASMKNLTKHPDILVPPEYRGDLDALTASLKAMNPDESLILQHGKMRLRAAFFETANSQKWVALRKIADRPPAFDKLGIDPSLAFYLKDIGKRGGLILVCGATGQGKTTTCCSLLVNYMETYGGVGFTIEDPVEYDMGGRHGESGFCYQVEIREENEWADTLVKSLRCHPRYIFIGEVCTPDAASQLLRAATSGHLVIATVHAGSLQEGLEGLLQLAEQKTGERGRTLLASSLAAILHQSLNKFGLQITSLIVDNSAQASSVRALIRDNKIGQITTAVEQQHAQLAQNGQLSRKPTTTTAS